MVLIIVGHFMTKKCRVSVIVLYTLVKLIDRDSSDSGKFYYSYKKK